jgi:branched-chain amino acid transport system ATP-binding protein
MGSPMCCCSMNPRRVGSDARQDAGDARERLRAEGMSVLLSEQNVRFALRVSDRAYIIDSGRIPYEGSVEALRGEPEIMKRYLAV